MNKKSIVTFLITVCHCHWAVHIPMSNFLIAYSYFCSLNDYAVEWLRFLYQSRSRLCCLIIFDVLDVRPITGVMKIIIYSHGKYIYTYKFIFLSHYIYMLTGRVKWIMYIYIYFFRNKIKSIRTVRLHQKYWAICWTLWLGVFPLHIEYLLNIYSDFEYTDYIDINLKSVAKKIHDWYWAVCRWEKLFKSIGKNALAIWRFLLTSAINLKMIHVKVIFLLSY